MNNSHSETSAAHADHHDEHHGGVGTALKVFGALLVLTVFSFWVGNSDLMRTTPKIGWALMMAVSCAKAMLVISFFMHLLWEANWKYVLTIPASIMSVFLVLMLVPDVGMRGETYTEERERFAAIPQEVHPHGPGHAAHGEHEGDEHEAEDGDEHHADEESH